MLPEILSGLRIPVIAAPLFIISNPKLVIAQCKAGIVGSMPAGIEPTIPALHCAMTNLGFEIINNGAAITGILNPLNISGNIFYPIWV